MATKKPDLGTRNCLNAKQKKKTEAEEPAAFEWDKKQLSDSDTYLSVSGAGTLSAFDVTTTFAFVSLTPC